MTGEEVSGPAGPKLVRLIWFVGAAVICTVGTNKWLEYEKKTIIQQQQGAKAVAETPNSSESVAVHKALK